MKIRSYHTSDKPAVTALLRLNTPGHFAAEEEPGFLLYLEAHAGHYFVIEDKTRLLACGGYNLETGGHSARISWDIVHPAHQGKGLGRELLLHRIRELRTHPHLETLVVRTSQTAFGFYERHGFRLREVKKDYWAPGFDLYYMELSLAGK